MNYPNIFILFYEIHFTTNNNLAEVAEQVEYVERLFSSCASYINCVIIPPCKLLIYMTME